MEQDIKKYKFDDILLPKFEQILLISNPTSNDFLFWTGCEDWTKSNKLFLVNGGCLIVFNFDTKMLNKSQSKYSIFQEWRGDDIWDNCGLHEYLLLKEDDKDVEFYNDMKGYCEGVIEKFPPLENIKNKNMLWHYSNHGYKSRGFARMAFMKYFPMSLKIIKQHKESR